MAQSTYDEFWKFAEWYRNDGNGAVQSVLFSGRFQYEFAAVNADQGKQDEWNVRRMRLGVRSELFDQFTVHVEADFNPQERDPFYKRLTDVYVEWEASDIFALTVGKQGVPFHHGRLDLVKGASDRRSQQPRQQHVVSPGVHARRERVGRGA